MTDRLNSLPEGAASAASWISGCCRPGRRRRDPKGPRNQRRGWDGIAHGESEGLLAGPAQRRGVGLAGGRRRAKP